MSDGVVYIGKCLYAFKGEMPENTSVIVQEGTVHIVSSAFSGCTGLTSVEIPSSVTSIDSNAFSDCNGLKKVIVSDIAAWCGISFDNYKSNPLYYAMHLYSDADTEITQLVIPPSVTTIGYSAFYNCTGLTSVEIPSSVTKIRNIAFSGCTSLAKVTINSNAILSATTIRNNLTTVFGSQVSEYVLGNEVTRIGEYAFYGCTGLTTVTLPPSVKVIERQVFQNCSNIERVNISDINAWMRIKFTDGRSNPTFWSASLHLNGEEVTEVTVPESITELGDQVFKGMKNLKTIKMHDGITSIGACAFQGCFSLQSFEWPKSLRHIGSGAFHQCRSFDKVDLSNTEVDSIPDVVFYMCYNLTDVTLQANLKYLGERAFGTDTCLVRITSYIKDPTALMPQSYNRLPFNTFDTSGFILENQPIYRKATLYVPKGTAEAYRQSVAFANFENIVEMEGGTSNGDANGDGEVNITDITYVLDKINGKPSGDFVEEAADANSDGEINITDVTVILDIINSAK